MPPFALSLTEINLPINLPIKPRSPAVAVETPGLESIKSIFLQVDRVSSSDAKLTEQ